MNISMKPGDQQNGVLLFLCHRHARIWPVPQPCQDLANAAIAASRVASLAPHGPQTEAIGVVAALLLL
jgi:hypothetical protein